MTIAGNVFFVFSSK